MVTPRVLLLVSTTSYRTEAFVAAARALGAEAVVGSDRCHVLAEELTFSDGSLALDFRHPVGAAEQILLAADERPFAAIVPTSDATQVIAALAAGALGLPHNSPDAAYVARNKLSMRTALATAGVPCPAFASFALAASSDGEGADAAAAARAAATVGFPCVVKPLLLSASRGVMRADDDAQLATVVARLRALLTTPEMKAAAVADPAGAMLLVERFVPGPELAVEAILRRGHLEALAIFDKPDPLDGPCFEETIYVTPSRRSAAEQAALVEVTARAARAMGLVEGPVHAELRLGPDGPVVIEVAARPIGGLCSRTLRFSLAGGTGAAISLEEIVVACALGQSGALPRLDGAASGVMMIPIPRAGVLQGVEGVEEARAVRDVVDVNITMRVGEKLVPLPEGASYLGFLFARAETPAAVEEALREAHRRLRFDVAPLL